MQKIRKKEKKADLKHHFIISSSNKLGFNQNGLKWTQFKCRIRCRSCLMVDCNQMLPTKINLPYIVYLYVDWFVKITCNCFPQRNRTKTLEITQIFLSESKYQKWKKKISYFFVFASNRNFRIELNICVAECMWLSVAQYQNPHVFDCCFVHELFGCTLLYNKHAMPDLQLHDMVYRIALHGTNNLLKNQAFVSRNIEIRQ